ncbi:CmpA/NrtA family ABC transporter substrate-binding protein [Acuticoccus sp. MNP-M23]|uniref:CmpA/NrtA family ABC transporter substrate-binding protein n=1 Tax=Acuticoccus sp. MNP-M23 TaxID=3072793 RepID=UPI002815BD56|nr:CmpA/NrtA family ABC transporter substrate-binding protein [Acuticoccus sp. MNP-M23]WMS43488.1 CmpA/NrtA family ABC transporter substrate-binding protein [Acuticoccus sp. MNP-M23]
MTPVRIGFIPLIDCAGLVAAVGLGFADAEGLDVALTRETSWATLRDKLAVGAIDAAHLLAPIAVASKVGIGNPKPPFSALMSLSMNGNAISVSRALYGEMAESREFAAPDDLAGKGRAIAKVIAARKAAGAPRLTFAVVHPFSPHNYELRYVLGAAGIDPDEDVDLVVVPPPFVVDHLRGGLIDGFCVGAPWTSIGLQEGLTRVIAVKPQIWRFGPEKVLAVREDFAADREDVALRLIRAVKAGGAWADDPANRQRLAAMMAEPALLDMAADTIAGSLAGRVPLDDGPAETIADYVVFDRDGASFPWRSHALWFYSQMLRWGQVKHSAEAMRAAAGAYRPDLFRRAFAGTDVTLPGANAKVEGALAAPQPAGSTTGRLVLPRDGFFDGRIFDPDDVAGYASAFEVGKALR